AEPQQSLLQEVTVYTLLPAPPSDPKALEKQKMALHKTATLDMSIIALPSSAEYTRGHNHRPGAEPAAPQTLELSEAEKGHGRSETIRETEKPRDEALELKM
ncbi:hypothetical protein P7K49_006195, partial [Saguinus oedipus]